MSGKEFACDSCIDVREERPQRRILGIVVAVAVGIAAFSTASLVFADSIASARLPLNNIVNITGR